MLSSDDPVRVFQDFATLDLLSGGRAEIMAGRGSFIESFPLFGYDLDDYDELFAEKLELLLAAARVRARHLVGAATARRSTTAASTRGPLQDPLPVWIAVGGTPQSVVRAGMLGLPMALAIIGGQPERFAPLRRAVPAGGRARPATTRTLPLCINSHGFVADTSQQAADEAFPPFADDDGPHRPRARLAADDAAASSRPRARCAARTSSAARSEVIEKILFQHELFGHERFLIQFSVGTLPHEQVMRSIELFGTEVAPAVREEVRAAGRGRGLRARATGAARPGGRAAAGWPRGRARSRAASGARGRGARAPGAPAG